MPIRILKKDEDTNREKGLKKSKMLVGGQAKLDKNKNNKIDAEDFKILKAEKAKGRGQGLQDEKMKPGKPMKAALGAIALGLGAKKMMEKKGSKMPMGMGAAAFLAKKKKEMLGKKKGGMFKGYSKVFETAARAGQKNTGTSTIVGVKPNPKKPRKTYKSMEEMRKAKGFKPGESAKDFNKRQMLKREALKAAKATRLGKIVLPIAAAGVAAQQYLKSKMKKKKEEPKKKMGGGMMQKYAEGGDAKRSPMAEQARRMGQRKKKPGALGGAGRGVGKVAGRRAGLPSLPGKKKEDSSVTLGKFMKAKVSGLEESAKKGGMRADRAFSNFRRPEDAKRAAIRGEFSKKGQIKDAAYYKSIGLTGKRGEGAVKDFFKPESLKRNRTVLVTSKSVGGSVTVKTKLGRNKPTKMY